MTHYMEHIDISTKFEQVLKEFQKTFLDRHDDFFFTERDLHSYFYHLCIQKEIFILNNGVNLVHLEYPTPFKCSIEKEFPYIKKREITSGYVRSHIDMVLFNPNFICWVFEKGHPVECIKSLKNQLYSEYILDFVRIYTDFYKERHEYIFKYLLEFKYFRSGFEGIKQPLQLIKQDVEKLKLAREFQMEFMDSPLPFAENIMSLVFINSFNKNLFDFLRKDIFINKNKKLISIIDKQHPNEIIGDTFL